MAQATRLQFDSIHQLAVQLYCFQVSDSVLSGFCMAHLLFASWIVMGLIIEVHDHAIFPACNPYSDPEYLAGGWTETGLKFW
jgi:hypothetical protein